MKFEYYHEGLGDIPKLSVDGTVPNSIHLSHWQGNETDASLKADTSTEIALNLVGSNERDNLTRGIELVTNNHFDTDGVLSVWTMIAGERALGLREKLVPAAEAGDFSEFTGERAVRASLVIQGADSPIGGQQSVSPLADYLEGRAVTDEARAYELVLPEVERVLTATDDYEELWRTPWTRIERALESFARGDSKVEEDRDAKLSIITLSDALYNRSFDPLRHTVPFTAISHNARGELFLIAIPATDGWFYRIDYPYYSWAETVVRPRIQRRDLSPLIALLQKTETQGDGEWRKDSSELSSAVKFMDGSGRPAASKLTPDAVAKLLRAALFEKESAMMEGGRG